MSNTTLNLPFRRWVAQVSSGAPRSKSSYLALMAENLEALTACPWREAADMPVALANHDFTALTHFSDALDAYKMAGNYDASAMTEIGYAGMAAYRFEIPASARVSGSEVPLTSITLPLSRDRFLLSGAHVGVELTDRATPSGDWATVRGTGDLAQTALSQSTAAYLMAGDVGSETLTVDLSGITGSDNPKPYLWVYLTLEDYTDAWEKYDKKEKRLYAIEGSAMLVGGSAEVTFGGEVTPDAEPAVLLAGGSSPTWLQPLPTVNVGDEAPEVSASAEQVDTFFTSAVHASAPKSATWQISGNSGLFSFDAAISLFGTDPDSVSGSISVTGPDFSKAEQTSQGAVPTESLTEHGTMTIVTSGTTKYLHYISSVAGYYGSSSTPGYYYPARLHVYIQLPAFVVASESQGMYNVTSANAKWFTRINTAQTPEPATSQNGNGVLYGSFGSASTVAQVCDVASVYWMLKMLGGVPSLMDMCASPNEASRQGLESLVTGSSPSWSVSVGGYSFAVTVDGRDVTLSESASGQSWDFTLSEELAGEAYFDPAVNLRLGDETVEAYGMASVVGDFSHAVATFEAGMQPPHAEVLGRLARMSRAAAGSMLYLHPESGALADDLDVLRPVPRFWRASTDPTGQTACQPGLSVWYRRASTPSDADLGIVQRAAPGKEGVVSNPAFLQLVLLALRAPSAFGTRLVLQNFKPDTTTPTTNVATAVTNHFKLRFVAWRSPAEQWDGSNAFAMAAMASMPSIYRADGPASVAWSVDCTGSLLRFGTRHMSAERIGVSKTIIGDIAASAVIEIPIASHVGEGDVVLIAPEVLGFADGEGGASKWFGRPSDPSLGTAGWARYAHNLGWFPKVTGE
jgi:hypothetical protein